MDDVCRNCFWGFYEDGCFTCCYDWGCSEIEEDAYFKYAPPLCCLGIDENSFSLDSENNS